MEYIWYFSICWGFFSPISLSLKKKYLHFHIKQYMNVIIIRASNSSCVVFLFSLFVFYVFYVFRNCTKRRELCRSTNFSLTLCRYYDAPIARVWESFQQITLCFCFLPEIKDKLDRNSNIELSMTFIISYSFSVVSETTRFPGNETKSFRATTLRLAFC